MSKRQDLNFSDPTIEHGVELFAALAHPLRLRVLLALKTHGPLSVGNLTQRFEVEQSSMSHQLAILRRANLLLSSVEGRSRLYELADQHVSHIIGDALIHVSESQSPR